MPAPTSPFLIMATPRWCWATFSPIFSPACSLRRSNRLCLITTTSSCFSAIFVVPPVPSGSRSARPLIASRSLTRRAVRRPSGPRRAVPHPEEQDGADRSGGDHAEPDAGRRLVGDLLHALHRPRERVGERCPIPLRDLSLRLEKAAGHPQLALFRLD